MRPTKKIIPQSPADRWKDRFHRDVFNNKLFYGNFSIYITRPTFELLRRNDDKGRETYSRLRNALQTLHRNEHPNKEDWDYIGVKNENDYAVCIPNNLDNGAQSPVTILSGPYDVKEEMNNCNTALLIHIDFDIEIENISRQNLSAISEINSDSCYTLNSQDNQIYQKMVKEIVGPNNIQIMDYMTFDLSAARLLPTDLILNEKETEQNFRRILLQQFNEIRLIDDVTQVNYEQILAINRFDFNKSPVQNLSGRPGTGKSTIQHILVCETLLQPGESRGKRKLLYMATTKRLLDEAKEEIKSILQLVYTRPYAQASKDIEQIHFITEEELYINGIGKYQRIGDSSLRNVLELIKNNELIPRRQKARWKYWLEPGNETELVRILNNFVYGVFGSPSNFLNWLGKTSSDEEILNKFTSPINLISPGLETSQDIQPIYFWNPLLTSKSEQNRKKGCERVRDLQSLLSEEDGLKQFLHDPSLGIDGIWNQSGRIFASSLEIEKLQISNQEFDTSNIPTTWQEAIIGFDAIFIDESQDFSVMTYSVLLRFFSNRKRSDAFTRKPFAFIATGDEYQTIRGSLFQGNMLHINTMYEDWKKYLISISNDSRWTLADGLQNPSRNSLIANYRNSDTTVSVINNIVEKMYKVGLEAMPNFRRMIKSNRADVDRKGLITSFYDDDKNREIYRNWELVIDQLLEQQKLVSNGEECDTKVALVLPIDRIKSEKQVFENIRKLCEDGNPDITNKINILIENLNKMISREDKNSYSFDEWVEQISDLGIFSIEGIKGLTVPVVITFHEPLENYNSEWELMQYLSYILVAVSRPQFGLFIHTNTIEDFFELTNLNVPQQNTIPAPEGDITEGFELFLKNSTTPATPLSKLLILALNTPYSNIRWKRLSDKARSISRESFEFVLYLAKIFSVMKRNKIDEDIFEKGIIENIESLQGILSNAEARSIIEIELNGEYITRKNPKHETISTLEFYILLNLITRIALSDGVNEELFGRIIELSRNLWDNKLNLLTNDESFAKNDLSPTLQTYNWLNLFFSHKKASEINLAKLSDYNNNPWTKINTKKIHNIDFPSITRLPRIKVSPWKFPKPLDADFREPWMEEESYWTLPPILFEYIIQNSDAFDNSTKNKLNWLVRVSEKDPTNIIQWVSDNTTEDDYIPLNWLIGVLCNDNGESNTSNLKSKILRELAKEVGENIEFSSCLRSLALQYDKIDDLEKFLHIIETIKSDHYINEEIKSNFDTNLDIKKILVHWQEKYNSMNNLTKVPPKISNLLKQNYSPEMVGGAVEQINHLIQLNQDGSKRIIEHVVKLRKSLFLGKKADDWENDFASGRGMLNHVLNTILENKAQDLIDLCFEDDSGGGTTWTKKDVLKTVDLITWLSTQRPFKLTKVTSEITPLVSRDGLEKVIGGIIFDGRKTQSIIDSYHSKRAQIGHGDKSWYQKDGWNWNWRSGGHNFWNTTGYEREFATRKVVDRFYNPRDPFDPQLYTNDDALTGLIMANNFSNIEDLNSQELSKITNLFLSGGAELLAKECLILHALVEEEQPSIKGLVNAFVKFLRVNSSIYTSHLNGEDTKIVDSMPTTNDFWGTGKNEVSKYLPSTLTDSLFGLMIDSEREKMKEIDEDLGHYAVQGSFTVEELDPKQLPKFFKDLSKSLAKFFRQMNYYHELGVLSNKLSAAKFTDKMNSEDALLLLEDLLNQEHLVHTYTNSANIFNNPDEPVKLCKNTFLRYEIDGHQSISNVSFKNKKFNADISLLRDLINCWMDDDLRVEKVTNVLRSYFGEKSILNLTEFNVVGDTVSNVLNEEPTASVSSESKSAESMYEMFGNLSLEEKRLFRKMLNQEEE